jgi:hypothetical protein
MTDAPSQSTWDVYVTAEEPIVTGDLPPAPPSGDGRPAGPRAGRSVNQRKRYPHRPSASLGTTQSLLPSQTRSGPAGDEGGAQTLTSFVVHSPRSTVFPSVKATEIAAWARAQAQHRVTMLDALRGRRGLTGTKKGCDQDACGAWPEPESVNGVVS